MTAITIRPARQEDRAAIRRVEERAFGQPSEATLVEQLVASGDAVLELVAERGGAIVGHILFSRLFVERDGARFPAVALAPLAVDPDHQRTGVGSALVEDAHGRLKIMDERLSVVLGDPAYYGRFGYDHARAAGFTAEYQSEALQALAWDEAPEDGLLVYARAFADLSA
jgi:putative acetyltransferase